jgi:hypothetical protein
MRARSGRRSFCRRPSIRYGVDYDGNGRVDRRHSVPDVLASTANLLKKRRMFLTLPRAN